MARLQHGSGAAASTLLRILLDKDAPAGTRVRAAHCILEHAANSFELEDLEVRIGRLEKLQSKKQ